MLFSASSQKLIVFAQQLAFNSRMKRFPKNNNNSKVKQSEVPPLSMQIQAKEVRIVKFESTADVRYTLNLDDYSDEEIFASWFDPVEYAIILSKLDKSVTKLQDGKSFHEKKHTSVGLESITEEGYRNTQRNRRKAYKVVLVEQQAQRELGMNDASFLAALYNKIAAPCLQEAQERAATYQQEIQRYINSRHTHSIRTKGKKKVSIEEPVPCPLARKESHISNRKSNSLIEDGDNTVAKLEKVTVSATAA